MIDEMSLGIDDKLRFVIFGLACTLNVEFNHAETERLFDSAGVGRGSADLYALYSSRSLTVTARTEEYEPGTVWLRVESRQRFEPSLEIIAEWARYQVYHIRRRQDSEA